MLVSEGRRNALCVSVFLCQGVIGAPGPPGVPGLIVSEMVYLHLFQRPICPQK